MSVRWQIYQAVLTLLRSQSVQAALQAAAGSAVPVLPRKRFEHSRGFESQPSLVVVSEAEKPGERSYENGQTLRYGVLVGLVLQRSVEGQFAQAEADVREIVRLTLQTPVLVLAQPAAVNVPSVFEVDYDSAPAFNAYTWASQYDPSAQRFEYYSRDPMTSAVA